MQTKTRIVPARTGWQWLADGYRIYSKNPIMLALTVMSCFLLLWLVSALIPGVGGLISTSCFPAVSVVMMRVCRSLDQKGKVEASALFSGFSDRTGALLVLGVMYIVVLAAALGLVALIDEGRFFRIFLMGAQMNPADARPLASWVLLLLMLSVTMAYWFAPMLVAWHAHSVGKALFFSLFACLRNWRAFIVYACSLSMQMMFMVLVIGAMASWVPSSLPRVAASVPGLLLMLFFGLPVLYASIYVSYREVFAAGGADQG